MDKLQKLFESYTGQKVTQTEELNTSGSNRRYFRLIGGNISIIGVVGTNYDENRAFILLSKHFLEKGIKVPRVLAVSDDSLRYIQEDLGDDQLYQVIAHGRESGEYSSYESRLLCRTMEMLPKIQFKGAENLDWSTCFPESDFNERMILFDLNYFKYCFLKATGLDFNEVKLQDDFERLKTDLMQDMGETFMYRDFQARNIMIVDGEPYFIDFQGGRRGPIYYDVASFVWQARSRYPENLRKQMIQTYLTALKEYVQMDEQHFKERLRLFILFRTLQVLGAYGFRGYFEKKPHFLASVPYALDNLRRLLQRPFPRYPYLTALLAKLTTMAQFNDIAEDKRLEVRSSALPIRRAFRPIPPATEAAMCSIAGRSTIPANTNISANSPDWIRKWSSSSRMMAVYSGFG